jgi:hypothetical protein
VPTFPANPAMIQSEAQRHYRWNFIALVVDVSAFVLGLAFMDSATVLPLFLTRMGAGSAGVGVAQALQTLGLMLPPLFAAHRIHGRPRHKSFLLWVCGLGRAGLLTLPPVLLLWGESRPGWVLAWFYTVYALFWAMDGACQPSWLDIVAKTIPARARGRLFGTTQVLGGLLAAGAGWAVHAVLREPRLPFPREFVLLTFFWCAGAAVSQVALWLIREPAGDVDPSREADADRPPLRTYMARAPALLRANPLVGRIIAVRVLLGGAMLALPFYTLFAREQLGVSTAAAGLYLAAQKVGEIATGPLWGVLSDRMGPAFGLRVVAAGVAAAPFLALAASADAAGIYPAVFFLLGGTGSGVWILANNALLEAVSDRDRPLAVGIASLCQAPTALYAVAGGLMLRAGFSYPTLFLLTALVTTIGLGLACRLKSARGP